MTTESVKKYFSKSAHAAPLAVFRIYFGLMMFLGILRFWLNGWIEKLYIEPRFHFHYLGFEWVQVPGLWTYGLFAISALSALGILLGYRYRLSASLFFLSFTYIELMDKTTYLNHYYFISLLSFLLILLPAHTYLSLDVLQKRTQSAEFTPVWHRHCLQLLLGIVYFYAGLAKLNSDWLLHAQPLRIWLPTHSDFPLFGPLFQKEWMFYFMSWGGALYDLLIPFLLLNRRTRLLAFALVLFFHGMTSALFPIGMFPYIMIGSTLIFFSEQFHRRISAFFAKLVRYPEDFLHNGFHYNEAGNKGAGLKRSLIAVFFLVQLCIPFRYLAYPGELFWTEEGYRFSWRVMLIEKAGVATFFIQYPDRDRRIEVNNRDYLTAFQEKQMATQPDFILEFAHFLADEFAQDKNKPAVFVQSYVALNGRRSSPYIRPDIDLSKEKQTLKPKTWITPFSDEIKGL